MSTPVSPQQRTDRRRILTGVIVLTVGVAILAAGAALALSWRAELPDPVASHWGLSGEADGFTPLGRLLVTMLGLGALLVLLFGGTTWALGQTAVNRRIGAAATIWVSVFITTVVVGSLYAQRGLADARDVGPINDVLLAGVVASIVAAVVTAFLVPPDVPDPTTQPVAPDAPRVKLVDGERAMWIARVSSPVAFAIGIPIAGFIAVMILLTRLWGMLIVDVAIVAALVMFSSFVVRVDREGLTVRSSLGWPRYRVPLDEVVRADVTEVSPMRDFGGWGWRVGRGGKVGVALRRGEALEVARTSGRSIVVTVDQASTAAGLLNALADRARGRA